MDRPSLSDELLSDVITEIHSLWPECHMVHSSPWHSQSNGRVERVNRTVQAKLGLWMQQTNSRLWSVGCRIVMWRYNTQQHRTVGDIPYCLLFGQKPRVGISSLHMNESLLNTLATETELNQLVALPPIDEPFVNDHAVQADNNAAVDINRDDGSVNSGSNGNLMML
jgi:hypothetical protein